MSPDRTTQQREPVADRNRNVFLRAGAGTGKTTVLVDRYCAAALDPEVGVERILAFTFTERAADQLRRRVREQIGDEIETDRAFISTIHGFCRRVLASHPAAAGIDPRFRVVDEPEADRLAARAFDAALERLVSEGDAEALEFAAANRRRTLLEMTRGAYDELRSHGYPEPALPAAPPVDTSAALSELIEAATEAHVECAEATGSKGLLSRERIGTATELDPAAEPGEELLERLGSLVIVSDGKHFKEEACERYTRALKRTRSAVAASVLAPAYEQLRELVTCFGRSYEELKVERSALDFEDLQLRTVELLAGSELLRERYREQFLHLMVDEFQDTNGLQLRLIEALRGPDTRLFLVGDEFQSIYGFRHADVEVYRREHQRFAEGAEPDGVALPLTGNFRAAPELVAATNAIGAALLDGFEPLTASVEAPVGEGPLVELLLTEDKKKEWEADETELPRPHDDPSSGSKVAEARRLAARLRQLVDDDAELEAADVVVLLRAFTHVSAFERALSDAGLDPYVVGGRGFWSQQQIEDLRSLLAVIANPLNDEALFGALASPACAVLPDTLWLLRKAATEPGENGRERLLHVWPLIGDLAEGNEPRGDSTFVDLIPEEELELLRGFATTLNELRERGTEGGLETLVDRAATAFGYDLATLVREDGPARWANARKLMRLAREFEAREGPDLGGFLDYLEDRAASRDREAEAASRAEGHAGVRVMTVHAAKGLEFGAVAVADLGRNLQLGWTPLRVAPGKDGPDGGEATRVGVQLGRLGRPGERLHDYEDLTELATGREAEEEGRLAYVAATRAKRRLIVSGTFSPRLREDKLERQPISQQLIHKLLDGDIAEREVEIPAAMADGAPAGRMTVSVSSPGPGVGAKLLEERDTGTTPAETAGTEPPLGRPATPPALIGGLSYSALSDFKNCGYRFYVERVLGIAEPEGTGAGESEGSSPETKRIFGPGVAVHALLEWSARNGWRDPGEERATGALREQGLEGSGADVSRALELARAWLGSPLKAELPESAPSAEVPFVLSIAGTMLRGSIDLLVEREDGSALVVDYKTDRLEGRAAQAAERYEVQRDLYALAASSRGTPVETAYVFLERPGDPVRRSYGPSDLDEARSRIEALLARLADGRFPVTDRPHRALCHSCPARERLCSYGLELTMRDDPDPPVSEIVESALEEAGGEDEPQLTLLD